MGSLVANWMDYNTTHNKNETMQNAKNSKKISRLTLMGALMCLNIVEVWLILSQSQ